ncbi:PREDICTED: protein CDV3 homolog [Amphimedon queenslandica]|uniref:Protein CDV3 homolog n=1 Tax=Amphimedon queenslandica TaxID=400682 RepID=A0A1X7UYA7_AMPQE|nr:PREDICTED: protein CDV3 homolog [Amphimedon queenslandica]|eukprot:XP_003386310.1 PREDICTED: protein CDV3 homolog [Amphimedon queenslandica]
MADLDGFFAKKGKKKKKKPTLQNLEDAAELGQPKQEEEKTQPIVVALSNPPEDSEWLESKGSNVEINPEEIQGVALLTDEDSSEKVDEKSTSNDTEVKQSDTKIVSRSSVASPWQPVSSTSTQVEAKPTTTVTSLADNTAGGRYIPPSLRQATRKPHPTGAPPDLSSTQAFPSLTVATKGDSPKPPPVMKDYTELPLHNKFSALATD